MTYQDAQTQDVDGRRPILDVSELSVFAGDDERTVVGGVAFSLYRGESLAIVGESGSGKSLTARAILRLMPRGVTSRGRVSFDGLELTAMSERQLRPLRGRGLSLLMQDPFSMLNPLQAIGITVAESLRPVGKLSRAALRGEVERRLAEVGLSPEKADMYPFQLSGGMRQRAAIAASLAADPQLLIADEPTTALDATTQRDVLHLLGRLREARGMALVLITHDLKVAFEVCDRALVMYAGSVVEDADAEQLSREPMHPYTAGLLSAELPVDHYVDRLASIPGNVPAAQSVLHQCGFADRCEWVVDECRTRKPDLRLLVGDRVSACLRAEDIAPDLRPLMTTDAPAAAAPARGATRDALLEVRDLTKEFHTSAMIGRSQSTLALDKVSFQISAGESLGLVGESGSGKTTIARAILGLVTPDSGRIVLDGLDVSRYGKLSRRDRAAARRLVQVVFQDPYGSLNPVRSVGDALREAVLMRGGVPKGDVAAEVAGALELVGLPPHYASRRPAMLSGGERQRVAIARAVATRPELLICDEPVAALDVSVQAQVLDLLRDISTTLGISMLFITHDLSVVRQMADRAIVLYRGQVVEEGPISAVLDQPEHAYTQRLLESARLGNEPSQAEPVPEPVSRRS